MVKITNVASNIFMGLSMQCCLKSARSLSTVFLVSKIFLKDFRKVIRVVRRKKYLKFMREYFNSTRSLEKRQKFKLLKPRRKAKIVRNKSLPRNIKKIAKKYNSSS